MQKSACIVALALFASFTSSSVIACSCVTSKEKAKEVRERIGQMLEHRENVALLRAVRVEEVGKYHERAVLRVVKSWKGKYSRGSLVNSDTKDIGAGACDMSISAGQEILVGFESEPIRIIGCPSSFELTRMERKYLDRLARHYRKSAPTMPTSTEPESSVGKTSD